MSKKKPTGLGISRNKNTFTFNWTKGETYQKQDLDWRVNSKSWNSKSVTSSQQKETLNIGNSNYYPLNTTKMTKVSFRIRGKTRDGWSEYNDKSQAISIPSTPTVSATRDSSVAAKTTFNYSVKTSDTNFAPFYDVEYQSMLVHDSTEEHGSKLTWSSSADGWITGTKTSASGNVPITESYNISTGSHRRWFRIRSRGWAGASSWQYISRGYSSSNQAQITGVSATENSAGGIDVLVTWDSQSGYDHPITVTDVQYAIETPTAGMHCPSNANWQTVKSQKASSATSASFSIDSSIGLDQCLFVRVNNAFNGKPSADKNTYGAPKMVLAGYLTEPTITSVDVNTTTHRATITATNNSDVPDSVLVVKYMTQEGANEELIIGVIPHGSSSVTVQCPDWGTNQPAFGVYAIVGDYSPSQRADGVSCYAINRVDMQSAGMGWEGGSVPIAPSNVSVEKTDVEGSIRVTWDWAWEDADAAIISWADHKDAWESTDEPDEYRITNLNASTWIIAGLATGKRWYVRVRFVKALAGGGETASPYSDMADIDLSSAPAIPALTLSASVITVGGSVTAYWAYTSTDGTNQASAEIADYSNGQYNVIATTKAEQHVTIYAAEEGWTSGETHNLCVRVTSVSGKRAEGWSNPVPITVAQPLVATITQHSLVSETIVDEDEEETTILSLKTLPFTATVTGAGTGGTTSLAIERASDYQMARPDESTFHGFKGETLALIQQMGEGQITITRDDLIGQIDDGGQYNLVAKISDGLGQTSEARIDRFEVHWTHQAIIPEATAEVEGDIVKITVTQPSGYVSGDTIDIYRLSADTPELLVKGGSFGTTYVDPYPTIGEYGGHRVVYVTKDGDYITDDSVLAWTDLTPDNGDYYESDESIINFADEQILLRYDVDSSNTWEKDFRSTRYLGGSIEGDWNAGVIRSGSLSATTITLVDQDTIRAMRRLAVYEGQCRLRTPDGSSYTCDIQVSENRESEKYNTVASFNMTTTKVDPTKLDGITYQEWLNELE